MKKRSWLLCLLSTILLMACSDRSLLNEKVRDFAKNRWEKNRPLTFSFEVRETGVYQCDIFFSHVYDYQFPEVPLRLDIQYPDGHLETDRPIIRIKNQDGTEIGDCSGDYCDLWHQVQPARALQPGNYNLILHQEFNGPYLPNVLAAGIRIKKHD